MNPAVEVCPACGLEFPVEPEGASGWRAPAHWYTGQHPPGTLAMCIASGRTRFELRLLARMGPMPVVAIFRAVKDPVTPAMLREYLTELHDRYHRIPLYELLRRFGRVEEGRWEPGGAD